MIWYHGEEKNHFHLYHSMVSYYRITSYEHEFNYFSLPWYFNALMHFLHLVTYRISNVEEWTKTANNLATPCDKLIIKITFYLKWLMNDMYCVYKMYCEKEQTPSTVRYSILFTFHFHLFFSRFTNLVMPIVCATVLTRGALLGLTFRRHFRLLFDFFSLLFFFFSPFLLCSLLCPATRQMLRILMRCTNQCMGDNVHFTQWPCYVI